MSSRRDQPAAHPVIRQGDRPCIWMEAGLVTYKICDHDGECETCPMDAAMGGSAAVRPARAASTRGASAPWIFPEDRLYHRGHSWVMALDRHTLRCGLDAFAAALFHQVDRVILPGNGARLAGGSPACWVCLESNVPVPIGAPVGGSVRGRNPRLGSSPCLIHDDPYGEGWLFELSGTLPPLSAGSELLDGAGMLRSSAGDRTVLRQRVEAAAAEAYPDLQGVAADGGEISPFVLREIGAEHYRAAIKPLLLP